MSKTIKQWFVNARMTSLPQSMMPALVAVVLALNVEGFNLIMAVLAILGVMAAHLGMNLADDFFDYKVNTSSSRKKLVRQGIRARLHKYPYLESGGATITDLRNAIGAFGLAAILMGAIIFTYRYFVGGYQGIIAITLLTLIGGIFYSAPPLKLSYRGLGELVIGVIFGPLLMSGVYLSACGKINPEILLVSIPIGLLVTNILFTHSYIDQNADAASGKMTFARLLKSDTANLIASCVFCFCPFAIVIYGVVVGLLPLAYLFTLLALPRATWLFSSMTKFSRNEEIDLQNPPRFLGKMENWERICQGGTAWFMIRWYTARNLCSAFCGIIVLINLINFVLSFFC